MSILGIDLGTTNSVVAVSEGDSFKTLRDGRGQVIQPSVVSFHPNGSILVGADAKARRSIDPRNTLYSLKRLIGRSLHSREAVEMQERMPFEIIEGKNQMPVIKVRSGQFAVPEISALVLDHMKGIANDAGIDASSAVITVPASFNDAQRTATATAGSIAGLNVVRVINEPTAAALAYGFRRQLKQTVAVYDFGGGTFDITLLRVDGDTFEVLASAGDSFLGGEDIDALIVKRLVNGFLRKEKVDLNEDPAALQRLYLVAEKVKVELSSKSEALVRVDEIAYGPGGRPLSLDETMTRGELEEMATELVRRTFPACDEALSMAGLKASDLTDLVMVGGTTRMPLVRSMSSRYFQRQARADVNPDEAVAIGASLQAMALRGVPNGRTTRPGLAPPSSKLPPPPPIEESVDMDLDTQIRGSSARELDDTDVSTDLRDTLTQRSAATDVETVPGTEVQTSTETVPGTEVQTETRSPADHQSSDVTLAQPDRPAPMSTGPKVTLLGQQAPLARVAPVKRPVLKTSQAIVEKGGGLGAADLDERVTEERFGVPVVLEVTSHDLGIATVGGYCEHVITRNSRIPTRTSRVFSTSRDDQNVVRIRVCQGNSRRLAENTILGDLVLDGLEARARGDLQIEVEFYLDASGMLKVAARDKRSGAERNAVLEIIGAQSKNEVAASQSRIRGLRA